MKTTEAEKLDRNLMLVVRLASSFSLGLMAAFLYSIKAVHPTLRYEISVGTVVWFLVVGAGTWLFWRVVLHDNRLAGKTPKDRRIRFFAILTLSFVLIAGTIAAFGRGLANLPSAKVTEVLQGTAMAFGVLAILGFVFWRVVKFLEDDHRHAVGQNPTAGPSPEATVADERDPQSDDRE